MLMRKEGHSFPAYASADKMENLQQQINALKAQLPDLEGDEHRAQRLAVLGQIRTLILQIVTMRQEETARIRIETQNMEKALQFLKRKEE